jgi:hypothetical protein
MLRIAIIVSTVTFAAGVAMAGSAARSDTGPVQLSAAEMDTVTAGVGANNRATRPWSALKNKAGFDLHHLLAADNGAQNPNNDNLGGVAVPSAVPGSVIIVD